jgi:type III restriction enzyme
VNGRLALFRNFDEVTGNPLPRPNTLLIDSEQLEAGDALDDNFRGNGRGRNRTLSPGDRGAHGDAREAESHHDRTCFARCMNTGGNAGRLGEQIRASCSVRC